MCKWSALLDPGRPRLFHDLAPAHDLVLDELLQLLRRVTRDRDQAAAAELLADLRLAQDVVEGLVEQCDDRYRRGDRRDDHLPGRGIEARDADLRKRRDLRRRADSR